MKFKEELGKLINLKIKLDNYCLPHFYPENIDLLNEFQEGYKFNSISRRKEGGFKDNWYVLCSGYANDPFFIDISEYEKKFPVYFAWHGRGNGSLC